MHVYQDGSIHLNHGGTEMGQGLFIKVAQVVAEEFGVDLDHVKITPTTTGKVPNTSPTAASSGSDINGMAARAAAGDHQGAADRVRGRRSTRSRRSRSRSATTGASSATGAVPFAELVTRSLLRARFALVDRLLSHAENPLGSRPSASGRPFFYFAYGAACSEVIVDTLTGEMKVERVDILHDVGRSLNPAIDIGQIEGGFVQGMGWLTTEELVFDPEGRLLTPCAVDLQDSLRVRRAAEISASRSSTAPTARTRSTAPRRWASRR